MSQKHSIWTEDLTPHVVNFMTKDITPDFSGDMWTKDITHHVVGTLAVFGLVISAGVATLGVTTVGVNAEVAFSNQAYAAQTAAVVLADNQTPPPMPTAASSTPMGHPSLAAALFCPQILHTLTRGYSEATTTGDVGQLQQFLASRYGLAASSTVTGYFGPITEKYLEKFQQEQGISPAPWAGPLTRAAIARLCGQQTGTQDMDGHMGSSTNTGMMASGTPPMEHHDHPMPPMPPKSTTPTAPSAPVSYIDNSNSSNTAALMEAVNEIGDGYGRLFQATIGTLGL